MNENIDLTKILKDCPKGTKLYSTIFGAVEFDRINKGDEYPIVFVSIQGDICNTAKDGRYYKFFDGECTLFPSKDQRDWSKFTAPWYRQEELVELKESDDEKIRRWIIDDIRYNMNNEPLNNSEYKKKAEKAIAWLEEKVDSLRVNDRAWLYLVSDVLTWKCGVGQYIDNPRVQELAKRLCSEYAQKLYNPSVLSNSSNTGKNEQKSADKVEPKFKVGDKIRHKYNHNVCFTITDIEEDYYVCGASLSFCFANQDQYELIPNKQPKFDPKTLEPFDRVLVKCTSIYNSNLVWRAELFSYFYVEDNSIRVYTLGSDDNSPKSYVIPYNADTKHLVNTEIEAPEFYRYWED